MHPRKKQLWSSATHLLFVFKLGEAKADGLVVFRAHEAHASGRHGRCGGGKYDGCERQHRRIARSARRREWRARNCEISSLLMSAVVLGDEVESNV